MPIYRIKFFKWFLISTFFWILFVLLPSFPGIRNFIAAPLIVSDENARGNVVYILAGGYAFKERLSAAADLYHMDRIQKIIFLKNNQKSSYNFNDQKTLTLTEWWLDHLAWLGVPSEKIVLLDEHKQGFFGTLSEAKFFAREFQDDIEHIVLVTSAPHTRRSLLTFQRVLNSNVKVVPYAATDFKRSIEMYEPLWLEYLKLIIYFIIA